MLTLRWFPLDVQGTEVFKQVFSEVDPGLEISGLHPLLYFFHYHKFFFVYYSVINPNLLNSKHSSLRRYLLGFCMKGLC